MREMNLQRLEEFEGRLQSKRSAAVLAFEEKLARTCAKRRRQGKDLSPKFLQHLLARPKWKRLRWKRPRWKRPWHYRSRRAERGRADRHTENNRMDEDP